MAHDTQVSTASAADLAADMDSHRKTYKSFLNIVKYTAVGVAIVLIVLFLSY